MKRKENGNKNQDLHKFQKCDAAIAIVIAIWDVCIVNSHFNFKWQINNSIMETARRNGDFF